MLLHYAYWKLNRAVKKLLFLVAIDKRQLRWNGPSRNNVPCQIHQCTQHLCQPGPWPLLPIADHLHMSRIQIDTPAVNMNSPLRAPASGAHTQSEQYWVIKNNSSLDQWLYATVNSLSYTGSSIQSNSSTTTSGITAPPPPPLPATHTHTHIQWSLYNPAPYVLGEILLD